MTIPLPSSVESFDAKDSPLASHVRPLTELKHHHIQEQVSVKRIVAQYIARL